MTSPIHTRFWPANSQSTTQSRPFGVYLLHGTGEHSGRYESVAHALSNAGFAVGAHDHPGHGLSGGERGLLQPTGVLSVQAAIQIQAFAERTGAAPVVLGHSLGGLLATELVLFHQLPVQGLVLSAPAYRPWISWKDRIKLKLFHALVPDHTVELPYRPEALTHDEAVIETSRQDPLIHGYKSARLVRWFLDSGAECIARANELKVPTLALVAGADPVVDPKAIHEWVDNAPINAVTLKEYPTAYHEIYNEVAEIKNAALADTLQWLELQANTNA